MAGKSYVIKDNSGVEFYSNGTAKIGGLTVDMRKPERLNVLNTTIDLFRHTPIPVTNSVYNRIGYGIVASQNTGGEVLYPIQKLRDGVQSTDTNNSRFNYDAYSIRKNEGIKLQGCYLVRDTNGKVSWIRGKNNSNSNIHTPNGTSPNDYVFSLDGTGRAVNTKTKQTTTWGYELIEKKGGEADKTNTATASAATSTATQTKNTTDTRVQNMQKALNAAGYTDQNGKRLAEDGLIGSRTRFAAQQAGIDPNTWNGTPAITPKSQKAPQAQQAQPQGGAQPLQQTTLTANTPTTFNRQATQYNRGMYQQAVQKVNADAAKLKLQQQQQQTRAALDAHVNSLKKTLIARNDQDQLNKVISFTNSGNFEAAKEAARRVAGGGRKLESLINAVEASKKQVAESVKSENKETIDEVKSQFYNILDRINNATISQI